MRSSAGETIVITRHGRPIARIVPEVGRRQAEIARAVEDLRALRRSIAARGESLSWDELKAFRDEVAGTRCVLDSSVALAWVLPGEGSDATEALLDEVAADGAAAPGLWPLETGVLLQAEKARRITLDERRRSLTILAGLPIHIDPDTSAQAWGRTLSLAEAQGLTLYDASYLELALRLALPLASLDRQLRQAAASCGVVLGLGREAAAYGELISPALHVPALPYGKLVVPLLVAQEGERAAKRYVEFFAAQIRNPMHWGQPCRR